MLDLLDEIDRASATGLYYLALLGALAIPDICAALNSPDGRATGARYIAWYDQQLAQQRSLVDGRECYNFRCSLVHQANLEPVNSRYDRLIFFEPSGAFQLDNSYLEGALVLNLTRFVSDLTTAARTWLLAVTGTQPFEDNFAHSVRRWPSGIAPHVVGVPVIG